MKIRHCRWMLAITAVIAAACGTDGPAPADMATEWVSSHGFTVNIQRDGRYTFCDRGQCFTDRHVRFGEGDRGAVMLKRLGNHPEAARFLYVMEVLGERNEVTPDLQFVDTGDLLLPELCDRDPCVIFGSLRPGGLNMIFRRREDL